MESTAVADGLDPVSLRRRVGDGDDLRHAGSARRSTATSNPSRTKVEHAHAVLDPGPLAGQREHRLLSGGEIARPLAPPAAGVLQPRPEEQLEELGRELVVLFVGASRRTRRWGPCASARRARQRCSCASSPRVLRAQACARAPAASRRAAAGRPARHARAPGRGAHISRASRRHQCPLRRSLVFGSLTSTRIVAGPVEAGTSRGPRLPARRHGRVLPPALQPRD